MLGLEGLQATVIYLSILVFRKTVITMTSRLFGACEHIVPFVVRLEQRVCSREEMGTRHDTVLMRNAGGVLISLLPTEKITILYLQICLFFLTQKYYKYLYIYIHIILLTITLSS